jgi:lysophospholipase L1-like esterase
MPARKILLAVNWRAVGRYGLIVLASLIGAEFLVRIWDWQPQPTAFGRGEFVTGDRLGLSRYHHGPGGFGDLVPGQDGHWVTWFHRPYHVQTNSVGLRNTEEPSDKAFRILAVGDSVTFGPFVANEDTWPVWTENFLRQRDRSAGLTQVFNAGIVGYTILDELAYVRDKVLAFKPQLVVLGVFENDLRDLAKERNGARRRPTNPTMAAVANAFKMVGRNLALVNWAEQVKTRMILASAGVDIRQGVHGGTGWAPPAPDDQVLAARYTALFREAAQLLKSHSIPLAAIFIPALDTMAPDRPSVMEPVIRAATSAMETPYLDLTSVFRAQDDAVARLYLMQRQPNGGIAGDGHLSREGNAIVGRAVADWLAAKGLVGRQRVAGTP